MAPRVILTAAMKRCWAGDADPLMLAYHDREWGVPPHGDRELLANLGRAGFQAGRCWAGGADPLMLAYHDREWGVPLHGDRELFAKLVLDGFQAGLSWAVILHKRARFLEVFDGFDPDRMARYDATRIARLLRDPGI